ncbi:hypothetical protein [Phaeobacter piscinae]|uniref:Uncharacterized protein n=1 Tax=Phaeobacter piscinae TaxID=1580596 RepID=A0AAN1LCG0_9RHOB|nr:hypothetical protein [Phaeobacter piscinae]ATG45648.1 hypothetical protein PhaeoP13_03766 [Phaeobacter piscinae]AUQ76576.1 hypothetical protein PhaeoP71_03755 [Phaeobacter piscinae]
MLRNCLLTLGFAAHSAVPVAACGLSTEELKLSLIGDWQVANGIGTLAMNGRVMPLPSGNSASASVIPTEPVWRSQAALHREPTTHISLKTIDLSWMRQVERYWSKEKLGSVKKLKSSPMKNSTCSPDAPRGNCCRNSILPVGFKTPKERWILTFTSLC